MRLLMAAVYSLPVTLYLLFAVFDGPRADVSVEVWGVAAGAIGLGLLLCFDHWFPVWAVTFVMTLVAVALAFVFAGTWMIEPTPELAPFVLGSIACCAVTWFAAHHYDKNWE